MSLLDGGDFGSGFLSGMVASVIGSGIEGLGSLGKQTEVFLQGKSFGRSAVSTFGSRNKELFKALIIASGGVSGGISSVIAGGKFIDGFKQRLITSGLNHAAHAFVENPPNGYERDGKGGYRKINDNGGDEIDYLYEDGQIIESKLVSSYTGEVPLFNVEGVSNPWENTYGYRFNRENPALIECTGEITSLFIGYGELKAGFSLLKSTRFFRKNIFSSFATNQGKGFSVFNTFKYVGKRTSTSGKRLGYSRSFKIRWNGNDYHVWDWNNWKDFFRLPK